MADFLKLLETGTEAIGLKDDLELIQALAALAENWAKLAGQIDGIDSAEVFLDTFAADMGNEAVVKAFETAGLAQVHGKLATLLGKATDAAGKLPEKYRKLLRPIALFNASDAEADSGLVEWTLIDQARTFKAGDKFSFGFDGDASISFEAGDRPPFGDTATADPLLRLSAKAGVGAEAGATVPIKFGSVSGGAEVRIDAGLDYYFATQPGETLYGLAVAKRLPQLPNPFSFEGLWEAFQSPESGLSALVLKLTEKGKANIDLAIADAGSFGPDVLADLKVTIGAAASLERTYNLTFSAAPGSDRIHVDMVREMDRERKLSFGIDVGLDLSALVRQVNAILKRAVEKSDAVLARITPFLTPGTYLQTELGGLISAQATKLIANEGLRAAIVRDLQGVAGIDTADRSALEAWLSGQITGALDDAAAELTGEAGALRDRAVALLAQHGSPLFGQAEIQKAVSEAIDPLTSQVAGTLRAEIEKLLPGNLLGAALNKVGASASEQIASLDAALAPVRKFIDEYNKLLKKAVAATEQASRAKLTARLQIEEAWQFGEDDRITGTFVGRSEAAADIYKALAFGDLKALRALVQDGSPTDDFVLGKSSIRRFAARTSKADLELVLFGFGTSLGLTLDGRAEILVDSEGRVQVDSRGELEARFTGDSEKREVTLVDSFSLVRAKALAGAAEETRSIEMGVSFSHIDESLKLEELQGFVRSLESAALLPAGTEAAATAQFVAWKGSSGPRDALAADLNAKLWLTPAQAERFMMIAPGDRENGLLTAAVRRRLVQAAMRECREAGVRKTSLVEAGQESLENEFGFDREPLEDFILRLLALEIHPDKKKRFFVAKEYEGRDRDVEITALIAELARMKGLIGLVQTMGTIYLAQPSLGNDLPEGWDEKRYRTAQHLLARCGTMWVRTGGFIGGAIEGVPPATIAFLSLVAEFSGIAPATEAMSLTMTRRDIPMPVTVPLA